MKRRLEAKELIDDGYINTPVNQKMACERVIAMILMKEASSHRVTSGPPVEQTFKAKQSPQT